MDKKTFALAAIAPYYKDPTTCGYENGNCRYLTEDGRRCVFGKFLLNPGQFWDSGSVRSILREYKEENILVPKAVGILDTDEWQQLQVFHDRLAEGSKNLFERDHTLFTKEELEEYIANN